MDNETNKNSGTNQALNDLTQQLEKELKGGISTGPVDLSDKEKKRPEILEMESKINNLNEADETAVKELELGPEKELEAGEDLGLPKSEAAELPMAKKNQQEAKEAQRREREEQEEKERAEWLLERQKRKELKQVKRLAKLEAIRQQRVLGKKSKNKVSFGEYIKIIKKTVLFLVGLELLVYLLGALPFWSGFWLHTILPGLIIVDILVLGLLAKKTLQKFDHNLGMAYRVGTLAGLIVGLARAIFKLFWIGQLWTLVAVVSEPILTIIIALLTTLVVKLLIIKK